MDFTKLIGDIGSSCSTVMEDYTEIKACLPQAPESKGTAVKVYNER
jgi:hypothetical protein